MNQKRVVQYCEIYYMDLGQVRLGSRQAGIRPVLVVSSDNRNEYSPVIWVVIITSQIKRLDLKSHVLLPKVKGLPKQSVVENDTCPRKQTGPWQKHRRSAVQHR